MSPRSARNVRSPSHTLYATLSTRHCSPSLRCDFQGTGTQRAQPHCGDRATSVEGDDTNPLATLNGIVQANRWSEEHLSMTTVASGVHLRIARGVISNYEGLDTIVTMQPAEPTSPVRRRAADLATAVFWRHVPRNAAPQGALARLRQRVANNTWVSHVALDALPPPGRSISFPEMKPTWVPCIFDGEVLLEYGASPLPSHLMSSPLLWPLSSGPAFQCTATGHTKQEAYDAAALSLLAFIDAQPHLREAFEKPPLPQLLLSPPRSRLDTERLYNAATAESPGCLYTFRQSLVASSHPVVLEWWMQTHVSVRSASESSSHGKRMQFATLDSEGDWELVQVATTRSVLVTDAVRDPRLVELLSSSAITVVGKDLARDADYFKSVCGAVAAPRWFDVTHPLPFWSPGVNAEFLCRHFLNCGYGWKRLVSHEFSSPQWGRGLGQLLPVFVFYAAADACVIVDILAELAERRASWQHEVASHVSS